MSEEEIISQQIEKIKELEKNSIEPYAYSFDKNDQASEILDKYKELKNEEKTNEIASVAGRITRIRIMGKALFADIQDQNGKIQLYIKSDEIGEDLYKIFTKLIDIGDVIGAKGAVFRTKTGEISLWVKNYKL